MPRKTQWIRFAALALLASSYRIEAQTITEFPVLTATSQPNAITSGPDGNLWFTEQLAHKIGKITPTGTVTEYPAEGFDITAGPDGAGGKALWFTGGGRITTGGAATQFATLAGNNITTGPDGNLWLALNNGIARVSPSDPANSKVVFPTVEHVTTTYSVATGSDGNLWFIELDHNNANPDHTGRIARIDLTKLSGCDAQPTKCITEFPVPGGEAAVGVSLAAGPDGALWSAGGKVNRITTGGTITQFNSVATFGQTHITGGPDGAVWYTATGKIVRVSTSGAATEIPVSAKFNHPRGITTGPDGNIWFCDLDGNSIGRVNVSGGGSPTPTPTPSPSPTPTPTPTVSPTPAGASSVTIPVAASIHGAGGSFFHSDVRVFNRSTSTSVNVIARYHCFSPPCGNSPQNFMLSPREMRVFDDMIAVTFNAAESGGAIEFSSTGSLVVQSRLYTPSHPSPTNGMGVPGIPESEALTAAVVTSLSHSADSHKGFRSNVGAYNASDTAQNVTFTVYDGSGTQLGHTVANAPARTAVQVSNIFSVIGVATDVDHAYCVVSGDHNQPLLVYAGVIDNQSQDLAFVRGQANTRPAGADRATIPVAASIHGAGGSFFHTDATILNLSSAVPANVTARYRCFSGPCGTATSNFALTPRQMKSFDDMIGTLFAAPESGGAIEFSSDQPIVVGSRLYTPSRPAPTNGMGVPGLPEAGAPTSAVLLALSHSADSTKGFRSNVGAYNPNDTAQNVTFTLYDPSGTDLGHVVANAPARTAVQVSNVFAAAGFHIDAPNAYCIVHGDQNLPLLPYAGVIDNQSQDLAFIEGEIEEP